MLEAPHWFHCLVVASVSYCYLFLYVYVDASLINPTKRKHKQTKWQPPYHQPNRIPTWFLTGVCCWKWTGPHPVSALPFIPQRSLEGRMLTASSLLRTCDSEGGFCWGGASGQPLCSSVYVPLLLSLDFWVVSHWYRAEVGLRRDF